MFDHDSLEETENKISPMEGFLMGVSIGCFILSVILIFGVMYVSNN